MHTLNCQLMEALLNLEEIMVSIQALETLVSAVQLKDTMNTRVCGRVYTPGPLSLNQGKNTE